jgi:hypothetical protein
LKTIDVDNSPGEFIALREALQQARGLAARRRTQGSAEPVAQDAEAEPAAAAPPLEAEPAPPPERPGWIVDIEAVQALIHGDQSREAIYAEVAERSARIFGGPEMDDIEHAARVEQWAAQSILSGVPRSNALLGAAIGRFGWLKRYGHWDCPPIVRAVVDRYSDTLFVADLQDGKGVYARAYRMMWMSKPSWQYTQTVAEFLAMLRVHYPTVRQEFPPEKLAAWEQRIARRDAGAIARLGRWRDRTWARAGRFARRFHLDRLFAGFGLVLLVIFVLAIAIASGGVGLIFLLPIMFRAGRR